MTAQMAVPLDKAWKLLNHGPVTMITSAHGPRRNVMAAAWVTPLDFDPPSLTLVVDRSTHTAGLIEASGAFAVNIPRRAQAQMVFDVGHETGRALDKFAVFGVATLPAAEIAAPLIAGCAAWLECKVLGFEERLSGGTLVVADVVAAYADPALFLNGRWREAGPDTLHYVAGGVFYPSGAPFRVTGGEASPFA